MKKNEVAEILKRIKSNYQDFIVDEYKTNEWFKELKDYDFEDVMKKVEEHMRSEDYGNFPPKLYFLTKYLKTIAQKNTITNYKLQCTVCGEHIPEVEYNDHYDRCMDVDYIVRIREKYFNKKITKEMKQRFMGLSQEQFNNKFLEFLNEIYNGVPKEEQYHINQMINPPKYKKFDLGEKEYEY